MLPIWLRHGLGLRRTAVCRHAWSPQLFRFWSPNLSEHQPALDSPANRTGTIPPRWSQAVAERYGLDLSPTWCDWFDRFPAGAPISGEFGEPLSAGVLLGAAPEVIWPGLMPPDFLPLAGNGLGDWLGGRVAADNTISEVVYWYHGGGDCLPYGRTMAEAIVCDVLADRFPGRQLALAIPAEPRSLPLSGQSLRGDAIRWACEHLPAAAAEVFLADFPAAQTADHLVRSGVAEVPIRCDIALSALDNEVRRRMTPQLAARLRVRWDQQVVRWMFDPGQMPADQIRALAELWGLPPDRWQQPDWGVAAEQCRQVADQRHDLAWVHDILGWASQRQGDISGAITHYQNGALASVFTDQAVRFRTHFDSDRACKFSVARLLELDALQSLDPNYVQWLVVATSPADIAMTGWRDRTSDYWLDRAGQIGGDRPQDAARRYDLIYRAGWDVGCDSILRYDRLLEALQRAATEAGQTARASLAKTHRDCFRSRYGIVGID